MEDSDFEPSCDTEDGIAGSSDSPTTNLVQELLDQLVLVHSENAWLRGQLQSQQERFREYGAAWEEQRRDSEAQKDRLQKQISVHAEESQAHAQLIEFIYEDSRIHFEAIRRTYDLLLEDLYRNCAANISQWKADYEAQAQAVLLEARTGAGGTSSQLTLGIIWEKFQGLSTPCKVLIVIGIIIIVIVLGIVAWKFIIWAWPILVNFASALSLPDWIGSGYGFLTSDASMHLLHAWQTGEPLTLALVKGFGSDLLPNILRMAPDLLSLIKGA